MGIKKINMIIHFYFRICSFISFLLFFFFFLNKKRTIHVFKDSIYLVYLFVSYIEFFDDFQKVNYFVLLIEPIF